MKARVRQTYGNCLNINYKRSVYKLNDDIESDRDNMRQIRNRGGGGVNEKVGTSYKKRKLANTK